MANLQIACRCLFLMSFDKIITQKGSAGRFAAINDLQQTSWAKYL